MDALLEFHGGFPGNPHKTPCTRHVEECFINRNLMDLGAEASADIHDGTTHPAVPSHIGRNDNGLGAESQGLGHRHGGMDTEHPCLIGAGRCDAPGSCTSNYDRLTSVLRVIQLLYRGKKGIYIHVEENSFLRCHQPSFRMPDRPSGVSGGHSQPS